MVRKCCGIYFGSKMWSRTPSPTLGFWHHFSDFGLHPKVSDPPFPEHVLNFDVLPLINLPYSERTPEDGENMSVHQEAKL